MARFATLFEAAEVLCDLIERRTGVTDVAPGVPLVDPESSAEAVRVTLLWVTPQPTHRNDPWQRAADGTSEPPPLTLSGFFLVTSYGTAADGAGPIQAYTLLGTILRAFHTEPELELPLTYGAGRGEGVLGCVQVPTAADLMEKVFTPLQVRHRPWALFEVGPIQLVGFATARPDAYLVAPGGVRLSGPEVRARSLIDAITPSRVRPGGRVRVDGTFAEPLERIRIGAEALDAVAITVLDPGSTLLIEVPDGLDPGAYDLSLTAAGLSCEPRTLTLVDPEVATLDAPALMVHSRRSDLILTGQGLMPASAAMLWPETGISSPDAVLTCPVADVGADQITVRATALSAAVALDGQLARICVRIGDRAYTPYIRLRLEP